MQPIAPRSAEDQARQVATAQLLQQVAVLANSVTRLARKMQHNHGHLSPAEQAQLDLQLRLLDTHMAQLHHNQPNTTNTAPPLQHQHHHRHHHHPVQQHGHHQPRHHTLPLHGDSGRAEDKARSLAHTSSTTAGGPAEEPQKAANGLAGRRRTKRVFQDRACQDCDTRFTSQWRTGPTGPSTLCNACGIRHARLGRQQGSGKSRPVQPPQPAANVVAATRSSIHFLLN